MRTLTLLTALTALSMITAAPVEAQGRVSELKRELKQKERAAKSDLEALVEVARWAQSHGLTTDKRRILNKVLKADPENTTAHQMLGHVRFEDEWMTPDEASKRRAKARESEFKENGWVEVDDVWVEPDRAEDAEKGVFWDGDVQVSRSDRLALNAGLVRHPRTGHFIDPADLPKAESGQFQIEDGQWVDENDADKFHEAVENPWVIRTRYVTVVSNRRIAQLSDLAGDIDTGFEAAARVFGGTRPNPEHRPVIILATDDEQYREMGTGFGAEGSAYSVFYAAGSIDIPGLGIARPAACNWNENWIRYWIRHAAALAYAENLLGEFEAEAPLWFRRGVAAYGERFFKSDIATWFGQQFLQANGFEGLDGWFDGFQIQGGMEWRQMDRQMFQAALLLSFAMDGGNTAVTEALQSVTEAVQEKDRRGFSKAVRGLEKALRRAEPDVRDYLKKLTAKQG